MAQSIEEKIVFGYSPSTEVIDGEVMAYLLLGVPQGAWDYMKEGKTHTLDLTKLGLPIRLILFGSATHDEAMKVVESHNRRLGLALDDRRRQDFSLKPKP